MNDLDAIIEVVDEISHIKRLDDDTLSHAYDLCIELIDIFDDEMFRRGLVAKERGCLPDRLDITSKHPRVTKPIDDCFSIYDYIGPNKINLKQYDSVYGLTAVKFDDINQAINDVEADLDNYKESQRFRHDEMLSRIDTLCGEITVMDDRVASVESEVEAIKESIGTDNLQEQLEKDFADVYEEFQNTKDQVNDINIGYIKWSSEVSQFDERIEKLEENMKEIAANGGLGLSFNLMNERVSSNKRDILSLRNDIDVMHSWINIHDRTHKEELKQMSDLSSELDDYKEAYKHLNNADEALERRIKAIENRLNVKPFYGPDDDD